MNFSHLKPLCSLVLDICEVTMYMQYLDTQKDKAEKTHENMNKNNAETSVGLFVVHKLKQFIGTKDMFSTCSLK